MGHRHDGRAQILLPQERRRPPQARGDARKLQRERHPRASTPSQEGAPKGQVVHPALGYAPRHISRRPALAARLTWSAMPLRSRKMRRLALSHPQGATVDKLKLLFKSRKFWAAVIALALILARTWI